MAECSLPCITHLQCPAGDQEYFAKIPPGGLYTVDTFEVSRADALAMQACFAGSFTARQAVHALFKGFLVTRPAATEHEALCSHFVRMIAQSDSLQRTLA